MKKEVVDQMKPIEAFFLNGIVLQVSSLNATPLRLEEHLMDSLAHVEGRTNQRPTQHQLFAPSVRFRKSAFGMNLVSAQINTPLST